MNLSPDMARAFAQARPQAQHCSELTVRGPRPEERAEHLATWRREVARELAQDFAELLPGARLLVQLSDLETLTGAEVFERIGPIAANSLLRCGTDDQTLLLSFDLATAIALTDRSFGGDGKLPEGEPPTELPRSAALLSDQAAKLVAQAISRAAFAGEGSVGNRSKSVLPKADVIIRSESAVRLKPFARDAKCVLFTIDLIEDDATSDGPRWRALLSVTEDRLERLLPGTGAGVQDQENGLSPPRSVEDQPFAAIPLSLEAVLAEFDLSLAQLERLSPGESIPLAVPREIPLRVDDDVFALGSLGTFEDRMALQLTRFAQSGAAA
ncbi:MAG: FliM/FliN family flagellar motor switch protein [Pseudomonadota bacterium]